MAMEAVGVKNWRTYSKALTDLVDWGFIDMVQTSKNQYSSNIIAIVKNTKASTKALDKALQKHSTKQSQSTVSIDKQVNNEQGTKNSIYAFDEFWNDYDLKKDRKKCESKWKSISEAQRDLIKSFIPIYKAHEPDTKYRKNPYTFLNSEIWNDDWNAYPPKQQTYGNNNQGNRTLQRQANLLRYVPNSG
jgi:hypothetical protein